MLTKAPLVQTSYIGETDYHGKMSFRFPIGQTVNDLLKPVTATRTEYDIDIRI